MTEATAVAEAPANDLGLEQDLADAVVGTWAEDTEASFVIAPDRILDVLTHLRDASGYDFLSNLTCIDYKGYGGKLRAGIERAPGSRLQPLQHAARRRLDRAARAGAGGRYGPQRHLGLPGREFAGAGSLRPVRRKI